MVCVKVVDLVMDSSWKNAPRSHHLVHLIMAPRSTRSYPFARGPYAATSDVPTVFWGKRAVLRWHNAGESAIAGVLCQWLNATVNFGVSQESNSLFFLSSGTYWPKTKFPCLLFVIKKVPFLSLGKYWPKKVIWYWSAQSRKRSLHCQK